MADRGRPFPCGIGNCSRKFGTSIARAAHQRAKHPTSEKSPRASREASVLDAQACEARSGPQAAGGTPETAEPRAVQEPFHHVKSLAITNASGHFICQRCSPPIGSQQGLETHFASDHSDQWARMQSGECVKIDGDPRSDSLRGCHTCDLQAAYATFEALQLHVRKEHRAYVCECGRECDDLRSLKEHRAAWQLRTSRSARWMFHTERLPDRSSRSSGGSLCRHCSPLFETADAFEEHFTHSHPELRKRQLRGESSVTTSESIADDALRSCSACDEQFRFADLEQHERAEHPEVREARLPFSQWVFERLGGPAASLWREFIRAALLDDPERAAPILVRIVREVARLDDAREQTALFQTTFPSHARQIVWQRTQLARQSLESIRDRGLTPDERRDAQAVRLLYDVCLRHFAAGYEDEVAGNLKYLDRLLGNDIRTHCWSCRTEFWRSETPQCGQCKGNDCPRCKECLCNWSRSWHRS